MSADLDLALRLADAADAVTAARFHAADLRVTLKPDASPVTDADVHAEEAMRAVLLRERPQHAIVGEELGAQADAAWRWHLDPIDGTRNYARGVPVWATLIALHHHDEPMCAVVSAPALGRRWWAAQGEGAFVSGGARLRVSAVTTIDRAYLTTTDRREFARRGLGDGYARLEAACAQVRAFGDFWSHMLVAEGGVDVGIDPVAAPWDLAAMQLIVEEAGGRFSDLHGVRRIDGGNGISSNGALHDAVLTMLSS